MKKSCVYCGGIHDRKEICPKKPLPWRQTKQSTEQSQFRSRSVWTKKSRQIKKRDGYLCQICVRGLYDTTHTYNDKGLEVHHIIPVKENYGLRLEDSNLVTLCTRHHKMADSGDIPQKVLQDIAQEQTERESGLP